MNPLHITSQTLNFHSMKFASGKSFDFRLRQTYSNSPKTGASMHLVIMIPAKLRGFYGTLLYHCYTIEPCLFEGA